MILRGPCQWSHKFIFDNNTTRNEAHWYLSLILRKVSDLHLVFLSYHPSQVRETVLICLIYPLNWESIPDVMYCSRGSLIFGLSQIRKKLVHITNCQLNSTPLWLIIHSSWQTTRCSKSKDLITGGSMYQQVWLTKDTTDVNCLTSPSNQYNYHINSASVPHPSRCHNATMRPKINHYTHLLQSTQIQAFLDTRDGNGNRSSHLLLNLFYELR